MKLKTITGKPFGRRAVLAGGAAALSMPFITKLALADAKPFRISLPGNEEEWQSKGLQAFKANMDKNAAGQFDVQIHYNGTLFGQGTEIEAMQRGNLEVALVSPQDITNFIPEYSIFTTGYLMRDPKHLDAVYDGDIGKEVGAKVAEVIKIHLVRSQYLGTRHVILRKVHEVKTPADMAGIKLRMPPGEFWQFLGESIGANPTPVAYAEVYTALQSGAIDGQDNPLVASKLMKFYEVTSQFVLTAHVIGYDVMAITTKVWDGMKPDQQAKFQAAAEKAIQDVGKTGVPNARFIVLDPNGEYARAFADRGDELRLFRVPPVAEGERPLDVPAWLWSGHEWTAVAHAQPGAQRPLLMQGLREAIAAGRLGAFVASFHAMRAEGDVEPV